MEGLVKIFSGNNHQSKVVISFLFLKVITTKNQKQLISEKLAPLNVTPS